MGIWPERPAPDKCLENKQRRRRQQQQMKKHKQVKWCICRWVRSTGKKEYNDQTTTSRHSGWIDKRMRLQQPKRMNISLLVPRMRLQQPKRSCVLGSGGLWLSDSHFDDAATRAYGCATQDSREMHLPFLRAALKHERCTKRHGEEPRVSRENTETIAEYKWTRAG